MKKRGTILKIISLVFVLNIISDGQGKPFVSLSDGNYWIYHYSGNYAGTHYDYTYIRTVVGDTVVNGYTYKILKDREGTYYWFSDENALYSLGLNGQPGVILSRSSTDSTACFGKKYPSVTFNYHNPPSTAITNWKYCGQFGYWSTDSYSGGAGGSSYEVLKQAYLDGVMYGKYPSPLKIDSWSVENERLKVKFSTQLNYYPHKKIIIYKGSSQYGYYSKYDSVQTNSLNPDIVLVPGTYYLRFSYRTEDGYESAISDQVTVMVKRTKPVISTTNGNYWIYNTTETTNGNQEQYYSLYTAQYDTSLGSLNVKKTRVIEFRNSQTTRYNEYFTADTSFYRQYDKSGRLVYNLYVKTDWTQTEEIFGRQWPKRNASSDTALVYINNIKNSGYDKITFYDKLGIGKRNWTHYQNDVLRNQKDSKLVSARMDGQYYGKIYPPPLINKWQIQGNSIQVDLSFLYDTALIEKIIAYKYSTEKNKYLAIDSSGYASWSSKINYEYGDNKFRLTYRTKDGIESLPTEVISYNKVPTDFKISQNYPNPFNGQTKITFELGAPADVELDVINVLGQKVYSERKIIGQKGYYEFNLKLDNISSGIYFYRITTSTGFNQTNKMVLMK